MDLLKSQFDRIQQQLAGLGASQKMLAACLVVIIVMTVSWWGRYAAVPEMETVVEQALAPEDLAAVRAQLKSSGIPFQVTDGKVEVPSERLAEAAAVLTFSNALPRSSRLDFQSLVKDINPFMPQSTTDAQFNNYNQLRLAEVISKFPGVQAAQVFIDPTEKVRFNGSGTKPTATVSITMKRGEEASQRLVDAAAHLIGGSHTGLSWERVSVIVDGVLRRVRNPDAGGGDGGSEHLQVVEKYENAVKEKVREHFGIPQMSVSVTFRVAPETKHVKSHTYDKDHVIVKPVDETERTSESTTPAPGGAGEPGALPNTGMSIAAAPAGAGQGSTAESETRTKSQILADEHVTEISTPANIGTPAFAAVRIPRSYIADIIKTERDGKPDPNAAAPDNRAIQARFKQEMPDIRGMVRNLVGLESEQAVMVTMFTDLPPAAGGMGALGAASPSASVVAVASAHSREIALGGLAIVSLFMVSMMVRKGSPMPVAAAVALPPMGTPVLDASEMLAGEVSEGKSMLDAMELDEDAVRAQQMLDQVSSMVEENPDAAAGLVKRWLNRA